MKAIILALGLAGVSLKMAFEPPMPPVAEAVIVKEAIVPSQQSRFFLFKYATPITNNMWQLEASCDGVHWGVISDFTVSNNIVEVKASGQGRLFRVRFVPN